MPKRSRSASEAEAKPAKEASTATAGGDAKAADKNEPIAKVFEQLMLYESKGGNKWAAVAYNKVVKTIRGLKTVITKGSDVAHLEGFGKAAVTKIDEFLTTGTLKKLDEFKETFGALPSEALKSLGTASTAAAGKTAKGAAAKAKGKPVSAADLKKIKAETETYSDMSADKLKGILKANGQTTTGTKADLADRCAQGKVLGRIPLCPLCCAGKLRFDLKTGIYSCPGFMDDDTFSPCFFKSDAVDRLPWVEA